MTNGSLDIPLQVQYINQYIQSLDLPSAEAFIQALTVFNKL